MTTTKEVPTPIGERFRCPCGGSMKLAGLRPRDLEQEWECAEGCDWIRDWSSGGPEWRKAD